MQAHIYYPGAVEADTSIPGAHWPNCLAYLVTSKPVRDLTPQIVVYSIQGTLAKAALWPPHSGTHTREPAHTHEYIWTQLHGFYF